MQMNSVEESLNQFILAAILTIKRNPEATESRLYMSWKLIISHAKNHLFTNTSNAHLQLKASFSAEIYSMQTDSNGLV